MKDIALLSLLMAVTTRGAIAAGADPVMAVRDKVIFADDFKGKAPGPKWA
jgi:hypothetical protein